MCAIEGIVGATLFVYRWRRAMRFAPFSNPTRHCRPPHNKSLAFVCSFFAKYANLECKNTRVGGTILLRWIRGMLCVVCGENKRWQCLFCVALFHNLVFKDCGD